mmetsp:Transcript_133679/g.250113  ORF Transcript_133679/g.250113 Transcript_133679/m.250113 type:complete len:333 (-) Transcript_133679:40-1038(-)
MDYSKWDNVDDSEEEEETRQRQVESSRQEQSEFLRELQEAIDRWLRKQISRLPRDGHNPLGAAGRYGEPDLHKTPPPPMRNVTKAERETLAMLVALSDFEEGETNLDRHPMLLDLVRHNRWLEEDPGALELLCRVHHQVMRDTGEKNVEIVADPADTRMRSAVMCGINTLSAPTRAKCPGGLIELFTKICTPETEAAREMRKKWQTKEYAKDALFDSLFPDLRQYADADKDTDNFNDIWIIVLLGVLTLIGIGVFIFLFSYSSQDKKRKLAKNMTNDSTVTAVVNATVAAVSAAGAAVAAGSVSSSGETSQSEPTTAAVPSSPPLASKGAEL